MLVYRVVSLGQEVYFGPKRTEAHEAFKDVKENAELWSVQGSDVRLLNRKNVTHVKLQDVARYKV